MGKDLADLKRHVTLSAFERTVALPTVFRRQVLTVIDPADMEDRRQCCLLLGFGSHAGGERLDRDAVTLTDFEVVEWLLVVGADRDREPWAVVAFVSHQLVNLATMHISEPMHGLFQMKPPTLSETDRSAY